MKLFRFLWAAMWYGITLAFFGGVGVWSNFLDSSTLVLPTNIANPMALISFGCGFAAWTGLVGGMYCSRMVSTPNAGNRGFFGGLFSLVGTANMVVLAVLGIGVSSAYYTVLVALETSINAELIYTLAMVVAGCFLYNLICMYFIWSKLVAPKDSVLIVDKGVYYPGETKRFFPLYHSDIRVRGQEQVVDFGQMELEFSDATVRVHVGATLILDVEKAGEVGVRTFNAKKFFKEADKWLRAAITSEAPNISCGALFSGRVAFATQSTHLAGFPVTWQGTVTFANIVPNTEVEK